MASRAERLDPKKAAYDANTPPELFDKLNAEFNFDIDAAATALNSKCEMFFGPGSPLLEDSLNNEWPDITGAKTVFVNPPYGKDVRLWARRFALESLFRKRYTIVALLNTADATRWWYEWVYETATEIRFLVGRVQFLDNITKKPFPRLDKEGNPMFNKKGEPLYSSNQYDSVVVVWRPDRGGNPHVWWWDWNLT